MESIPISSKYCLTLTEAAEYFGIGIKRMRSLADSPAGVAFMLTVGVKRLIKRKKFEEFIDSIASI